MLCFSLADGAGLDFAFGEHRNGARAGVFDAFEDQKRYNEEDSTATDTPLCKDEGLLGDNSVVVSI